VNVNISLFSTYEILSTSRTSKKNLLDSENASRPKSRSRPTTAQTRRPGQTCSPELSTTRKSSHSSPIICPSTLQTNKTRSLQHVRQGYCRNLAPDFQRLVLRRKPHGLHKFHSNRQTLEPYLWLC
jgi:hypothetical protein